jgi:hypothetical protein
LIRAASGVRRMAGAMDETDSIMAAVQAIFEMVQEEFSRTSSSSSSQGAGGRWTGLDADAKHKIDVRARDEVRHWLVLEVPIRAARRPYSERRPPASLLHSLSFPFVLSPLPPFPRHSPSLQVNRLRAVFRAASASLEAAPGLRLLPSELEAMKQELAADRAYYE